MQEDSNVWIVCYVSIYDDDDDDKEDQQVDVLVDRDDKDGSCPGSMVPFLCDVTMNERR